ncbi:DUF397 domain-containing protein [Saccharopolyspora sp. 7B]|uniref:DUF397 domain-containing protein n=1 Tax=Saccharopolyspora sp. 7B TaxID=2877240 RepID=UPI001CD463B6|nr:DUF397 domain-containing protein [Saccharopolyspora sp. 7B]MCA1282107.1 DUF397 domain-containing protein [Saccharopolyspora sp. 7B]
MNTGNNDLWRKSSYSGGQTNCVEVGRLAGRAGIRDSKDRDGGALTASSEQWSAFISALKDGRFEA